MAPAPAQAATYSAEAVSMTTADGKNAGHWWGLLHTFQNGCSEPNDGCSDTAEEAQPQYDCPSPAPNTCPGKPPGQPVLDPIHNFMVGPRQV